MNKMVIYCSIGTMIEWAEFTFYAYMNQQFASLFFPMFNPDMAILVSFGAFAVSYLARPLGGMIFGHLGDKYGRNIAFSSAIILMALVTLSIGILPTYATIGAIAPMLLVALRFLQGLAVSGEFTGAAIYLLESDAKKQPCLASSWTSTFSAAGMLVGSLASFIVSLPHMPGWAWRIPFCLGFLVCLLGLRARRLLPESPAYKNLRQTHQVEKTPLLTLIKHHKLPILQTMALAAFVGIYIYTCNIWWASFVVTQHYYNPLQAKLLITIGQGSVVVFTPLVAMLADRCNYRMIMRTGFIAAALFAPLLFVVSSWQLFWLTMIFQILYALCNALVTAPMFSFLASIFPPAIRCSGQAVGWSIAAAIFGGTAPMLAQYLLLQQLALLPFLYVSISAMLALIMCTSFEAPKESLL